MRKNYVRGTGVTNKNDPLGLDETDGTTEVISGDNLIVVYNNDGSSYKVLIVENTHNWLRPDIYPGLRPITPSDPGWFPLIDPNIMVINKPPFSDLTPPPGLPGLNGQPFDDLPVFNTVPTAPAKGFTGNGYKFDNGNTFYIKPGGWKLDPHRLLDPINLLPNNWTFELQLTR